MIVRVGGDPRNASAENRIEARLLLEEGIVGVRHRVMTAEQSYRIVVVGELGDWLEHHVGAATIEAAAGFTTITGFLQDPSELQALTKELSDLGLEIERATLLSSTPNGL